MSPFVWLADKKQTIQTYSIQQSHNEKEKEHFPVNQLIDH